MTGLSIPISLPHIASDKDFVGHGYFAFAQYAVACRDYARKRAYITAFFYFLSLSTMLQSSRISLEITLCFLICLCMTGIDVFCLQFHSPIPDIAWLLAVSSLILLPILAVRKFRPQDEPNAGIHLTCTLKDIIIGIAIVAILFIPVSLGHYFFQTQWAGSHFYPDFSRFNQLETSIPYEILIQIFCIALPEEFFYRGYMQTGFTKVFRQFPKIQKFAVPIAIVVTSLFFALSHLPSGNLSRLLTFFPGLLFGTIRYKTNSLVPAILCHAGCNMMMYLLNPLYG